jgi:hypothetical protein
MTYVSASRFGVIAIDIRCQTKCPTVSSTPAFSDRESFIDCGDVSIAPYETARHCDQRPSLCFVQ